MEGQRCLKFAESFESAFLKVLTVQKLFPETEGCLTSKTKTSKLVGSTDDF